MDIDESVKLAETYEIDSVPTFVFFKQGEAVDSVETTNMKEIEDIVVYYIRLEN